MSASRVSVEQIIARMRAKLAGAPDAEREVRLVDDVTQGIECQRILEHQVFQRFWAQLEARLTDELLSLPLRAHDDRMRLAVAVQTTRQLQEFLHKCAQSGRLASAELDAMRKGVRKRVTA